MRFASSVWTARRSAADGRATTVSFNQRLLLAFIAPAALFFAGLAGSIWALAQTQTRFDHYIKTEQATASGLQDMYAQGLQMGQALRNILLDPSNPQAYKNLAAARAAFDTAHQATLAAAKGTPTEALLAPLAGLRSDQAQAQDKVLAMVKTSVPEAVQVLNSVETPAWRKLRGELLQLGKASQELSTQTHAQVNTEADRARAVAIGLALLAVSAAVALGWVVHRTLQREIGGEPAAARNALRRIADGDLSADTPASRNPDSLMGALLAMQTSMRGPWWARSSSPVPVSTWPVARLPLGTRT